MQNNFCEQKEITRHISYIDLVVIDGNPFQEINTAYMIFTHPLFNLLSILD